jgi:hypothetical protein
MIADAKQTYPNHKQSLCKRHLSARTQALILFLIALAVYWATPTGVNTFDAVAYANQIGLAAQTGTLRGLFHPHHLLFNALGFALWRLARALGYGDGPLVVLQRLNAVAGAWGVALFFLTIRRYVPRRTAWCAAGLLALSFSWWICATDGRVNMINGVLLLAAFSLLGQILCTPSRKLVALCGFVSGVAVLFHESAGLFVMVGLLGMVMASREGRAGRCLAFSSMWTATILLPYLLIGVVLLHLHSLTAFRHWSDAYAEQGQWWDFHITRNLGRDGYALRHAVFVEPPGRAALGLNIPHSLLGHLWRMALLVTLRLLYVGTFTGWLAALTGLALAFPRLLRSRHRPTVILCLLWITVTSAFFTVWCPGYFVFWTPLLVPLLILLSLALREWQLKIPCVLLIRMALIWTILVALTNLTCSIAPHLRPNRTLWQRVAFDARAHTGPHALMIVAGAGADGQCEVDIPYFGHRACLSVHEALNQSRSDLNAAPALIQARITKALLAGRRVYVYVEIWTDPSTVHALESHHPGLTSTTLAALFTPFQLIPSWTSPRGPIYRLRLRYLPIKSASRVLTGTNIAAYNNFEVHSS